jgi:hypothetical protein
VHNLQILLSKDDPLASRTTLKRWGPVLPFFKSRKGISCMSHCPGILRARNAIVFSPTICSTRETTKKPTNELLMRTKFQRFLKKAPQSSFKKLVISTPSLLQGLHTMSLVKSVPEGLKPQECKRMKLCKPSPIYYILEKDKVQKEVTRLRNLQIKTSLEKDTTLNFTVWHKSGT